MPPKDEKKGGNLMKPEPAIRLACQEDVHALHGLIEKSVRVLQANDYTSKQIEGALGTLLGVDTKLISDQTYFVVEALDSSGVLIIVGCGGWSKRKTLFGADRRQQRDDELLNPAVDAAKIRAFFVHPQWARRGIGTKILETCEDAAIAAGFRKFELGATLTGVRLYRNRGYESQEQVDVPMENGEKLQVVIMTKAPSRILEKS
jgi:GNAT superfamily N-acetyltransferase